MKSHRQVAANIRKRNFLPIIALVILSAIYGCNTTNSSKIVNEEAIPAQKLPKTKVVTTFLQVYLFIKSRI